MLTPHGEIPDRLAAGMSMAEQHDWLAARVSRRTVLRGLLVAGASASPVFWQQTARAAPDLRVASRLLVPGADPRREMTVGIAVPGQFRRGRVEAAAADGGGLAELEHQPVRGPTARYARAALTGLQPGTEYTYTILLDGVAASSGTFRTAPDGRAEFRFTAFGDQGTGEQSRSVLNRVAALRPDLHLVAGDISYANQEGTGGPGDFHPDLWDAWLSQNDKVSKSVPYLCAFGNHEMEPGFGIHGYAGVLARLPLPGRSPLRCPASWAVRYGTVGFVGLDSNDASYELTRNYGYTGGAQRVWLRTVLEGFRRPGSGVDFVVVVLHHSPYSTNEAHGSEGGVRDAWVPLFDEYGVDLVIAGHNHCYERTLPLRGGAAADFDAEWVDSTAGTTYVTAGGGGSVATPEFIREGRTRVYTAYGKEPETIDWSLPARTGTHAVLLADVRPGTRPGVRSTMTLRAVGSDGRVLDTVELSRPVSAAASAVPATEGGDGLGIDAAVLAGAATAVAAGVAGGLVIRRRQRERAKPEEPIRHTPSSRVVVRPLLEPSVDTQTVVLRRPTELPGRTPRPGRDATGTPSDQPGARDVPTGDRRGERTGPDAPRPSSRLPVSPESVRNPPLHLPPVLRAGPDDGPDRPAEDRVRDGPLPAGGVPETGLDADGLDVLSVDADTVIIRRPAGLSDNGRRASAPPPAEPEREADSDRRWFGPGDRGHPEAGRS